MMERRGKKRIETKNKLTEWDELVWQLRIGGAVESWQWWRVIEGELALIEVVMQVCVSSSKLDIRKKDEEKRIAPASSGTIAPRALTIVAVVFVVSPTFVFVVLAAIVLSCSFSIVSKGGSWWHEAGVNPA